MAKKVIILGTAHLDSTPGKCSPDGKFHEPYYSREMCAAVKASLEGSGYTVFYDYEPLLPLPAWTEARKKKGYVKGEQALELQHRCNVVNKICKDYGKDNCCYISIHNNASGNDGKWKKAGGFSVWTSKGQTKGDILAERIYEAADVNLVEYKRLFAERRAKGDYGKEQKFPIRRDKTDGDSDYEAGFKVLTGTNCAACLVELMFQDTKADVEYLTSDAGFHEIQRTLVEGIMKYAGV